MQTETRYAVKSLKTGKFFWGMENCKPKFRDNPIPLSKSYASKMVKELNDRVGVVQFELFPVEAELHPEYGWRLKR